MLAGCSLLFIYFFSRGEQKKLPKRELETGYCPMLHRTISSLFGLDLAPRALVEGLLTDQWANSLPVLLILKDILKESFLDCQEVEPGKNENFAREDESEVIYSNHV